MALIDNLRKYRLIGFVIFDWVATFIASFVIAYYYNIGYGITLLVLLIISVFLHIIFNVNTKTNGYLGLNSIDDKTL